MENKKKKEKKKEKEKKNNDNYGQNGHFGCLITFEPLDRF